MKSATSRILFCFLLPLLAIPRVPSFAQITRIVPQWAREDLLKLGIDPENKQMVLDSLRSNESRVRFVVINFCGQQKIREALPLFREIFALYGGLEQSEVERYLSDRSQILKAVIQMEDTSFQKEFRMEIDSLKAEGKGRDVDYMIEFSSYLATKHHDDYGFLATSAYYSHLEDFLTRQIIVSVSYLKPFVTPQYRDELIPLLRKTAVVHPQAGSRATSLSFLKELQDSQLESLLLQASRNDPDISVRTRAREILGELRSSLYIAALIEAARSETRFRYVNYDLLIRTRQPTAYKYVYDVLTENSDPESNASIKLFLDNPYAFYPSQNVPTGLLLDSLAAAIPQVSSYSWLADKNFAKELNNHLENARKH
ncbi:MAG: hypothetical protein AABY09_01525, partial [Nanoarchaeota archaeon]